jgi:cob(I)alamin adenosyltransferase
VKGYIQVYTGDGKGKTTAAIGLAVRAAGAGLRVLIAQFIKRGEYSEIKSLKRFSDLITVAQFGRGHFIVGDAPSECVEKAHDGLACVASCIVSGEYDVVILEEANIAVKRRFLSVEDLLDLIDIKPNNVELVITGRNADPKIIARADLVTEMKKIKHYFDQGQKARIGIEK